MPYLGIILGCIIGYLIGSISWSIIIVWKIKGIDIRTVGSNNAGATNTTRELGKGWGFAVVFLDGSKVLVTGIFCFLLSMIPSKLFNETSYFIPALFAIIGHCFPIYHKFKGGKAVACFLGLLFISNAWFLIFFLLIWFGTIIIWKRVSVSSILGAIATGLIFIWIPQISGVNHISVHWNSYSDWISTWNNQFLRFSWLNYLHVVAGKVSGFKFADSLLEINIVILMSMLMLAYRHFPNIKRIQKRKEPKTFERLTPEEKAELKLYQKQKYGNSHQKLKDLRNQNKIIKNKN